MIIIVKNIMNNENKIKMPQYLIFLKLLYTTFYFLSKVTFFMDF